MTDASALIENGSATSPSVHWGGGRGVFSAAGTFSSATVSLQVLGPDGATWLDAGVDTTLTAAGLGVFDLPDCYIRASVSGGSPSGLYARAARVPR